MSDLIDRQAALDIFKPWLDVKGYSEGELNMLRAVIYELETMPSISAWVSVKDKLPDDGMECYLVLVDLPYLVGKYIDIAWYNAYNMYGRDDFNPWYHREECINYEGITHWMPLPKPPKE